MTTTYELYTNENGTPKLVEGKAPAIVERVENLETAVEEKLPLSGGTMTGAIKFPNGASIHQLNDASWKTLEVKTDGSMLHLRGKASPTQPSTFDIQVTDGTNYKSLAGGVNGSLVWDGKQVVRSINGSTADASGNVTITISSGIPIGTIIAYAANSAPSGYLLCNGSAVSRTTYADLFAKIGETYGSGDGSTTFNLPNLTDRFIQGSGTAGTVKSAGLPNITGSVGINKTDYGVAGDEATGAFTKSGGVQTTSGGTSKVSCVKISLDASRSNAIYGASTTVQPPALTMRYYIKY